MQISLLTVTIFFPQILRIQCETIDDPTLKPAKPFSASDDGEILRNELKSKIINRSKIARLFFHRTYQQRHEIQVYYDQKYCPNGDTNKPFEYCPFHSALKDISTESLDDLYNISLTPPEGIYAQTIHHAIESKDGEVGAIEEAVCGNDKKTKDLINKYYQANYQTTVEDHLATFKKDDEEYQNVMLKYCWKGLSQEKKLCPEDIDKETQILRDLHHKKDWDGFKKKLKELLDNTSEPDLQQIFIKYRHDKKGIDKAVEDVFKEERQIRAYNVLARYIEHTARYYAEMLRDTVDSPTSLIIKSTKINRIVLTRCERDLSSIFKEYHDKYGHTFTKNLHDIFFDRFWYWDFDPEDRYVECIRYLCGKP
ncbi:annexin B9-like [Planococcus citri]|uniref:annexin B9-like n=1 Tax=Planococcus citri TaxID=170843 RepID=UPI0031F97961